jgi:hypothetical protein
MTSTIHRWSTAERRLDDLRGREFEPAELLWLRPLSRLLAAVSGQPAPGERYVGHDAEGQLRRSAPKMSSAEVV